MEKYPFFVLANINEFIQPMDRGERYEDPLAEILEEKNLGEVDGGGSSFSKETGYIFEVDVCFYLANLDEALDLAKASLLKSGIPAGSYLSIEIDDTTRRDYIGELESLEIFLDAVGLPDEVYANLDFNAVYERLTTSFAEIDAEPRSVYDMSEETLITVFGKDANLILERTKSLAKEIPILQNARLLLRGKDNVGSPQEYKI